MQKCQTSSSDCATGPQMSIWAYEEKVHEERKEIVSPMVKFGNGLWHHCSHCLTVRSTMEIMGNCTGGDRSSAGTSEAAADGGSGSHMWTVRSSGLGIAMPLQGRNQVNFREHKSVNREELVAETSPQPFLRCLMEGEKEIWGVMSEKQGV